MKIILAIFFFICVNANATIYYVDNAGNDLNNGTSKATAWKTIKKVNESKFLPGDQILFKAGDVWNEKLVVPSSGNPGHVITFGSYGTGSKPLITGFQTLTGFTHSNNIWSAKATNSVNNLNTVLIDGILRAKGRYPNTGYLTFTSYNGKTQITGSLSGTPNYTGAGITVRSTAWILDASTISSQSGGTLNLGHPLTYEPKFGGNGYFIQNSPLVLDTAGEWCYNNSTTLFSCYSKTAPLVQISTVDTLVDVTKNYITFNGLRFQGANLLDIEIGAGNHITINNCNLSNSGSIAIYAKNSSNISILNSSVSNILSIAIAIEASCNYTLINNNTVRKIGYLEGMAMFGYYARYIGINTFAPNTTITNNRIDSVGYIGIQASYSTDELIKNNFVSNFCFVCDDGAGIYVVGAKPGTIIKSNIVINGIGAPYGKSRSHSPAAGIYTDNYSKGVIIDSNSVYNCASYAILLNTSGSIAVTNNTVLNAIGHGLCILGDSSLYSGYTITNNIIASQGNNFNIYRGNGTTISRTDSNYYLVPVRRTGFNLKGATYNLQQWVNKTSQDIHSISIPLNEASTTPLFYYNPKKSDSTISLNGTYSDVKGRLYKNSITLHSFCSAILYKVN